MLVRVRQLKLSSIFCQFYIHTNTVMLMSNLHRFPLCFRSQFQGRNHIFKVGGPVPWSRVLLPFYRKKLDKSTQFGAVGYIITLCSSKSYLKSWGSVQILGGPDPPTPSGCAHAQFTEFFVSDKVCGRLVGFSRQLAGS